MEVRQILRTLSNQSITTAEKGRKLEEFTQAYLLTDPAYANELEQVWIWKEWPEADGHDTGIDLVAQTKKGDYWAIQSKFYSEDTEISKKDVDTFISASGRTYNGVSFSRRIFLSTSDKWSKTASQSLENQIIPVTRIGIQQLEDSAIDWNKFNEDNYSHLELKAKHELREHQKEAVEAVHKAMIDEQAVRGKLIMSCGTGKTFTSLEIARDLTNSNGTILFLAPSISLISQSLREWISESKTSIYPIVICSDSKASKAAEELSTIDLIHPATTNPDTVWKNYEEIKNKAGLKVIFSTYQSIEVVEKFQKLSNVVFDLIINDEAHRTTGAALIGQESYFQITHNNERIPALKRLYMTATPRIYGEGAKAQATSKDAFVSSMDDPNIYGEELYRIGFAESIKRGLLTDYKVQIIAVDEEFLDRRMRNLIDEATEQGKEINLDDLTRIYGIWTGLSKKSNDENEYANDPDPMQRAIIYTNRIKDSKTLKNLFIDVVEKYEDEKDLGLVPINIDHIDGSMDAMTRSKKIDWLKGTGEDECRILTNAKCLSEGIDVPALDAVAFANPRSSIIDIIQSVGRAMRKDPAGKKKYGYVIIPVAIPAQSDPENVLKESRYQIIWNVLRALRAHDERLEAKINQLSLDRKHGKEESPFAAGSGSSPRDDEMDPGPNIDIVLVDGKGSIPIQGSLFFEELEKWQDSIFSKLVLKLGDSKYWETWAKDVAKIAQRFITRIGNLLAEKNPEVMSTFNEFLNSLQSNLNKSITEDDAKEMLAQHLITKPVFEALFKDYDFTKINPVSKSLNNVIEVLAYHGFDSELAEMEGFYDSVRERVNNLKTTEARQQVIKDLYNNFFKLAFEKQAQKLGIVYTPVEVIDFILHSVEWLLNKEFGSSLADEGVEILDPFSGTGSFIARLLGSGIIPQDRLKDKYLHEIHANEIVLLAYYISTINIEEVFHSLSGSNQYIPFEGMVLADTFEMAEGNQPKLEGTFEENTERIEDQKKRMVHVVISNPPYSVGQRSQNDNNQNVNYPVLNQAIAETYANNTQATNKNALYDSYIKAFRWATDRLPKNGNGIIGFVTNGSFIDNSSMDGFRKSLVDEFSDVYVFNLRGNARTQGEQRKKEKGNVFGSGSRTTIAITLLVRNSNKEKSGKVHYYDIGDYLSREDKLKIISDFGDGSKIDWQILIPDKNSDWINLRNDEFSNFIKIGDNNLKNSQLTIFNKNYSLGNETSRDPWCYNFSLEKLNKNMFNHIRFYNEEIKKYHNNAKDKEFEEVINRDPKKIKWTRKLLRYGKQGKKLEHNPNLATIVIYRPFEKIYCYLSHELNEYPSHRDNMFINEKDNIVIQLSGEKHANNFSVLMTKILPDRGNISMGQCFPLYWYDDLSKNKNQLFSDSESDNYAISDWYLDKTQAIYHDSSISKEDIFYYIYGILHSKEYRSRFASDLKKELPRIPFVKSFWEFSKAGRMLAHLHLNYESIDPYPKVIVQEPSLPGVETYKVEKMKFAKKRDLNGKLITDKSTIIYNPYITISGIPEKAYEYVINGRSAIDWIIEQYQIKKDKASGIINDPNDWAAEVSNPRYIFDLLLSVINISIQTVDIVENLPSLEILVSENS